MDKLSMALGRLFAQGAKVSRDYTTAGGFKQGCGQGKHTKNIRQFGNFVTS